MSSPDDYRDAFVPPEQWGPDHWSTLAYVETVMVECGGFEIGADARMRSARHNFRVMNEQCSHPKRPSGRRGLGLVMDVSDGSTLHDGMKVPGHDDWVCLQDLAAAGFFTVGPDDIEPRAVLHLSELGAAVTAQLRAHKAAGGTFKNFAWAPDETSAPSPVSG